MLNLCDNASRSYDPCVCFALDTIGNDRGPRLRG